METSSWFFSGTRVPVKQKQIIKELIVKQSLIADSHSGMTSIGCIHRVAVT